MDVLCLCSRKGGIRLRIVLDEHSGDENFCVSAGRLQR